MDAFAQVAGTPLGGSTAPIDMSVFGLFMQADTIVKVVMMPCLLASFWSWAIIFDKMLRLRSPEAAARKRSRTPSGRAVSLEDLYDRVGAKPADPMSSDLRPPPCANGAAPPPRAWRSSATARASLQQRIEQVMNVTIGARDGARSRRCMGFLATVGSTAPFVGLFGTVWGIMNSFGRSPQSKNTIARRGGARHRRGAVRHRARPGRRDPGGRSPTTSCPAEVARYAQRLEAFAGEFIAILSRQLEEQV